MCAVNWLDHLGWSREQIDDLRFAGFAYIRQGKYDIALRFYEALTILDPANAHDMQTLGALYLELNEPRKALKFLDQALQLEPNHPPTLLNLTKALFVLGKKEEALKVAAILKKNAPSDISSVARALILAYS